MKKWRSSISTLALVAALCAVPMAKSHAYTECTGLILTKVFTGDGGNVYVATGGYLNGYVPSGASVQKAALAVALAARVLGAAVTIRYSRDGVTCGNAAWSEVIEGIGM